MTEWYGNYSITTGSSTTGYLTTASANSLATPLVFSTSPTLTAPATPQPALEWLDGEIEKTCALAR